MAKIVGGQQKLRRAVSMYVETIIVATDQMRLTDRGRKMALPRPVVCRKLGRGG